MLTVFVSRIDFREGLNGCISENNELYRSLTKYPKRIVVKITHFFSFKTLITIRYYSRIYIYLYYYYYIALLLLFITISLVVKM